MSVRLMALAWALDVSSTDKLVLLALADWSNDDGHCWPSIRQLCEKSSLSERAVQASMKRLETTGLIKREMKPGKGTIYTINPRTSCTPAEYAPPQEMRPTPARRAPNTSVNTNIPSEAKASSGRARKAEPEVPEWIPGDEWKAFVSMRRQLRKPLTGRAITLAVAKLKALADDGYPPGAVLDQSTMRCWQGLFPIKDDENGRLVRTGGSGGDRPAYRRNPAREMLEQAYAEHEAERRSAGGDSGTWLALPAGQGH